MVILATLRVSVHFAEAVKQGKHVFMEKPVAARTGVRQVLLLRRKKKKNLKVGVGLQRHQLGYQQVVQQIHDGAIGDIVSARAYWNAEASGA